MSTLRIDMTVPTTEQAAMELARAYFRANGPKGDVTVTYYGSDGTQGEVNVNSTPVGRDDLTP